MSARSLMPDGMAGRFTLLLVVALVAASVLALAVLLFERSRLDRAALINREVERIVSLVPALEAAPGDRRRKVARDASTRASRVTIEPKPIVEQVPPAPRSQALTRELSEALGARDVRAAIMERPDHNGKGNRVVVAVSIRLSQADDEGRDWLNVVSRRGPRPPGGVEEEVFLLILGLSLVSVLGVGLIFVRRLTRPLAQLAEAAKAAGGGDRSARVAETGPLEMRQAAAAFNEMQTRIAQFDAERLRTLAAVGHDLRTPITSLRIRAEMLDEDDAQPMIRTLDEMKVMADGLVAFAKGDGDAEDPRAIALAPFLSHLCQDHGAAFLAQADPSITGRPVALRRAVGNVIGNALRYGGSAQVTLDADATVARITVDDNGPGIDESRLNDMFEPFVRGENSRNADTGGAGLGLAITQTIIVAHGGTVTLANRAEGGMRATICLPVAGSA